MIHRLCLKYVIVVSGIIPLCLESEAGVEAASTMSPEEMTDFMSNVGGELCGYPESVRVAIGTGLNLSLIAFGVMTLSYGK